MMIEMASSDQRESTDTQLRANDEPPSPPSPVSAAGRPPSPSDSSQGDKQQQQLGLLTTSAPHSSSILSPTALFLYFLCLVYSFAVLGLDMSLLGPSLLELAVQTGTGIGAMSLVFFCRSGGILGGTLLAGQLVDRFPNRGNRLLCIALWALVASTLMFPFIPWVMLLAVTGVAQGVAKGMVDNTAQLLLIAQYGERVDPYMQALHAAYGVGAFVSPLVLSPFLDATVTSSDSSDVDGGQVVYTPAFHYAWLIVGCSGIPCAVWLIHWARLLDSPRQPPSLIPSDDSGEEDDGEAVDSAPWHEAGLTAVGLAAEAAARDRRYELRVVCTVGVFLSLYIGCEMGYGSYVYSYAVTQLGTSADTAAYLNSAYWGCFALGRMAGVLASMHVQPRVMVITDLAGCCCALLINLAWHQSLPALWVGTCLYGFSVGSVYASCINHLQRLIDVSGRSLSSLTVFAAAGELIIPFIVGQLFGSSAGPLGMMYLCLVVAASAALVFGLVWKTDKQPVERPLADEVRSAAEKEDGTARDDPQVDNEAHSSTG